MTEAADDSAPLRGLSEVIFELTDLLNLNAPTEAGLRELPDSELAVLRLVTRFPGRGISFLTERTKMRQANVSAIVRTLVNRGLVIKRTDERDRRAVRLHASPQADADLEKLRQIWLSRLRTACEGAGLDHDDQRRLAELARAVRSRLD
ncbi:MAG TPA: MarR family transcriptional regulator [Pseudonocardiaceae bacterium]|nr:MarR family transcriptional regulator [Pseudonocardiaceae bacterium]